MSVKLTSVAIELGLGGRMRDIFVNEDFTQGCWPLAELFGTTFRDISPHNNTATLVGTGFTRGVATGLPEQHMGLTFDGNGYLTVPDDGNTGGGTSLAAGSMDIAFLIKTSHSSATERCIIQKRNGAGTNGYYVGLVSGAIRFQLNQGGGTVFNFTRGSISDNAWHLIHCYYDPPTQEARVFIDGVQSGATVATAATDPPYVALALTIGGGDPAGGSNFIGSLSFMDIGREGNLTLSVSLQAARTWTNVAADVRLSDGLKIRYGNPGVIATDWVASTGTCSFVLENSIANSAGLTGYYSPDHANCRAGFELGIPVRATFVYSSTTRYKFQGRIVSIAPETGPIGLSDRGVRITATDWFDVAARSRYIGAQTQVDQVSTDVLKYLIDQADQAPGNVSIDAGAQVFGFALDQGRGDRDTILSEFGRIASSEMMYLYMKGNDTDGMTFVASTRFARSANTTLASTFTNSMSRLEVSFGTEGIINEVRATCYPPTVDAAATSVLFTLTANSTVTHPIQAGQSITIDAPFTDPSDRPSEIGGTALVTPVATTDYTANALASGAGADRTSDLTVVATLGASTMRAVITNTGISALFLTKLQLRGKGIYRYQQAPAFDQDSESIQKYGVSPLDLDMPYQQSIATAQSLATAVKDIYGQPTTRPLRMTLAANHDDTVMTQALVREIGDHIGIVETVSGIVAGDGYFIHEVEMECHGLHDLTVSWGLIPPWPNHLLVNYFGPAGSFIHDLDDSPLELNTAGDYTFVFNRTGDDVDVRGAAGGGGGGAGFFGNGANSGGGGGGGGGAVNSAGITVTIATTTYTGKVGAAGGTGGVTEFRVPSGTIHMQLNGGAVGGAGTGAAGGAGGAGGAAGTGAGNVAGTAGGNGGFVSNGVNAANNATGAAGGGGGGSSTSGSTGGNGGNGISNIGGVGGPVTTAGQNSSGLGGGIGSPADANAGGGGGGAGGLLLAGWYYGGGGGGGGAALTTGGAGGTGGGGALTLTKA